jgi:rsbT antagonist protein RsbS
MRIPILARGRILLASIQVGLSAAEALEFQRDLLARMTDDEALGIAIDVSFLDVLDDGLAQILTDTASNARRLGVELVICGTAPYGAMTLAELGQDRLGADTARSLDEGMAMLEKRMASRGRAARRDEEGPP